MLFSQNNEQSSLCQISGSQVLFNKLLHSMKIIEARKISTVVDKQIKRPTVEEQINVQTDCSI
jgi:hypothetical protein